MSDYARLRAECKDPDNYVVYVVLFISLDNINGHGFFFQVIRQDQHCGDSKRPRAGNPVPSWLTRFAQCCEHGRARANNGQQPQNSMARDASCFGPLG